MELEVRQRKRPDPARGALLLGAWVLGCLTVALLSRLTFLWPVCHFREWTGIPCLTCGSTRMIDSVLSGHLVEAVMWNPLVFLGLAAASIWFIGVALGTALGRPARSLVPTPRERLGLWILGAVILAADWAYLIWRGV
jgi:hypothetical protein